VFGVGEKLHRISILHKSMQAMTLCPVWLGFLQKSKANQKTQSYNYFRSKVAFALVKKTLLGQNITHRIVIFLFFLLFASLEPMRMEWRDTAFLSAASGLYPDGGRGLPLRRLWLGCAMACGAVLCFLCNGGARPHPCQLAVFL
jgi:hypothetical protein